MTQKEVADKLAEAVRKFTSLQDFRKEKYLSATVEQQYSEHIEYRAQLYRDMCEALKEYQLFIRRINSEQTNEANKDVGTG